MKCVVSAAVPRPALREHLRRAPAGDLHRQRDGAWAAGGIFDRTGSYALALALAAVIAALAPTLLWIVAPRRPHPPPRARAG